MNVKIKLNSIEDAVKLTRCLEHWDHSAVARVENCIMNARSLMGLIGVGIGKVIILDVHAEAYKELKREIPQILIE